MSGSYNNYEHSYGYNFGAQRFPPHSSYTMGVPAPARPQYYMPPPPTGYNVPPPFSQVGIPPTNHPVYPQYGYPGMSGTPPRLCPPQPASPQYPVDNPEFRGRSPSVWSGQGTPYFHNQVGSFNVRGPQQQNYRNTFRNDGHQNWNEQNNRKRGFNNNKNHNGPGNAMKKPKMDKRDLPENNKFSCDSCNRGFKTEEQYETHVKEHIKCRFPGCEYVAHEKLVQMHYDHCHLSGYGSKISWTDSESEIEKWREERRRNFPTKDNLIRKENERKEAVERGEYVGKKKGGNGKNSRFQKKFQRREKNQRPREPSTENNETEVIKTEVEVTSEVKSQTEVKIEKPLEADKTEPVIKEIKKEKQPYRGTPLKIKESLFEKLIAHDVAAERNRILQCVRFMRKKLNEKEEAAVKKENEEN